MLPPPSSSTSRPRGHFSFALLTRNVFGRLLRWWHVCLLVVAAILWLSSSTFTPRRFRIRLLKSSRPTGGPRPPPIHLSGSDGDLWAGRAHEVRKAFVHAYTGYQAHALPSDELKPMSGERINNFHGWGVTMYDSLDTMWLMGLEDMFYDTVEDVEKATFPMQPWERAHFFEVVIRYLGGLLSAYALSEDPRLLKLADDLGEKLLPAFNTPSGFPVYGVNTTTHKRRKGHLVCLAEAFSNQMEFKYLAHITGKAKYYEATERPMNSVYGAENTMHDGLFGTMWDVNTGKPNQTDFSASGRADSAYEYFLKQWLLTGQKEPKTRDLYVRSANAIIEHLLYVGPQRELLYVTDLRDGAPTHRFEHLACFLPALLALGVHTPALGLKAEERARHTWAAEGLANMCWAVYGDVATGLSPDDFVVEQGTDAEQGRWAPRLVAWARGGHGGLPPGIADLEREAAPQLRGYAPVTDAYLLRPEAVETFYIMWRTTGDIKWRERGWAVFESLQKYSRVKYGYTAIRYLDEDRPYRFDDMPSWFMAETLKYLFLLFTDAELVPLDKWVFNTEAHPLPVFQWTPKEVEEYNIIIA
ncbi:glycoside hydrolase family 47 protein [Mycena rosella]|uniref:alpha-1,2-Mannosidase n=1 Tax=Mycena rosella TaxID=1033263 RepID=A0AAD7G9E6_MYCRO|nr:glycoside hydrolase family 47 protein [Mycena rosella]